MVVTFPLIVFEKDDRSMRLIEAPDRLLYHLEAVDIEDGEYVFWDASGAGLSVSVENGSVSEIALGKPQMSISDAFKEYSQSYGFEVSLVGAPLDVWARIQGRLPKKKKLWERLFHKSDS